MNLNLVVTVAMKLDLDIIYALLRSFAADNSPDLAEFEATHVNAQRELLLRDHFLTGHLSAPERKPVVWDYSHTLLTESGKRLLQLSANATAWERAKEAYDMMDQSWSLDELSDYLEIQSRGNRNA